MPQGLRRTPTADDEATAALSSVTFVEGGNVTLHSMRQTKLLTVIGGFVLAAITWIAWPVSGQIAREDLEEFLAYGISSISQGETARLHAVSFGNPDIQPAELVIYDRLGNILARSSVRLRPGRPAAINLRFDEQTGIAVVGNRLEFIAVVRFAKLREGYVIPSLEIIDDATGKTSRMVVDPIG